MPRVARWGNSLAVRLPAALVAELALKEGDEVRLDASGDGAISIDRARRVDRAFEVIDSLSLSIPEGYRFRRGDAYEGSQRG